jgi:predicted ATPase/DNA-binding winged helix-turn-helix (wHTH) protein
LAGVHRFGNVEVHGLQRRLIVGGQSVALGSRAFDLLITLIERRGELVTKNELLDAVWPGLVVEENNLSVHISTLRKILGSGTIATVPGRGYRFTAGLDHPAGVVPAPPVPPDAAVQTAASAIPTNLPDDLPPLYGREPELHEILALLGPHRLVTLVGAGGIGKTRLAKAVAHAQRWQWPDGAWLVELAPLADPSLVAATVAQALGIRLPGHGPPMHELANVLRPQSLLLVLDNCEHLLDAVSDLVRALQTATPRVRIMVTSQEPLKIAQEQQYRVPPLAVPQGLADAGAEQFGALALFEARVSAVDPHFALRTDNVAAAIDICRRLDGLPLAIELAAVRVPLLGVQGVRDRLDARFQLLTGGSRAALPRHQTLRAAIEWSHRLLSPAEQSVFRRLGVFAGGFGLDLVRAVAAEEDAVDEWAVIDVLAALVDKSLVVAQPGEPPRYDLLESTRAFALEQLAAAGETEHVLRRHAVAVGAFFERVGAALLDGFETNEANASALLPEADNMRSALRWATQSGRDWSTAIRIASGMADIHEFATECAATLPNIEPHLGAVSPAEVAAFWLTQARAPLQQRIPLPLQAEGAGRAAALYAALALPKRHFFSLNLLALYRCELGDSEGAQKALLQARSAFQPDWPAPLRARLINVSGHVLLEAGKPEQVVPLWSEVAAIHAATGDWRSEVRARSNRADLLWSLGRVEEARTQLVELASQLRQRESTALNMSYVLGNLAGILSELERPRDAAEVACEALPYMRRSGLLQPFFESFVYLFVQCGEFHAAARLIGAADAFISYIGRERQPNEERLLAKAGARLEVGLDASELARCLAEGASLGEAALHDMVAAALAAPICSPA